MTLFSHVNNEKTVRDVYTTTTYGVDCKCCLSVLQTNVDLRRSWQIRKQFVVLWTLDLRSPIFASLLALCRLSFAFALIFSTLVLSCFWK